MNRRQNSLNSEQANSNTAIEEADVIEYLRSHPDFFRSNTALLGDLSLHHVSGNAVSLVEKQVAVLRERSIKTRHKLSELLETAKENDDLFGKTQELVIGLMQAENCTTLIEKIEQAFRNNFDVEQCAVLVLEDEPAPSVVVKPEQQRSLTEAGATIKHILESEQTSCGALRGEEAAFIFSGLSADNVFSAAVAIRDLAESSDTAKLLLAVGNSDGKHYGSDTGTLFIDYIADILQIQFKRLIRESAASD